LQQCPKTGNPNNPIAFGKNIVASETSILFLSALATDPMVAIALPPQIAVSEARLYFARFKKLPE